MTMLSRRNWRSTSYVLAAFAVAAAAARAQPAPFSGPQERCILPAASYHQVNAYVLRAILRVESGLNPGAIQRNANGSFDLGIGQMNSMHFGELARHGIAPGHLLDGCIATYVAAWHLGGIIRRHGNSWSSIARYHSATPYFNHRYQVLLTNELIRSGVLRGAPQPVPPLRPAQRASSAASLRANPAPAAATSSLAFDGS